MKILLAITRLSIGGAGKFVVQLAKGLKKSKFNIHILYGAEEVNKDFEKELIDANINLLKVKRLFRDVNIVNDLISLLSVIRILKDNHFDVIHTHTTKAGVIVRLAAFLTGARNIIHNPHGHIYDKNANLPGVNSYMKRVIFFLIEKIVNIITKSKIVCVSEKEFKEILNMGYSSKYSTYLIPNGLSVNGSDTKEYKGDIKNILLLGRLSPEKGQDIAIEALRILTNNNYKNFKLTIVGEGNFKFQLVKLINQYNLQSVVEFFPTQTDVKKFYEEAYCILIPSRYEGFSITALEAFKYRRPVILTENCGIAKHLKHGIDAIISPPEPEKIAYHLIKLANDPQLYNNLIENAYKKLITCFSFEVTLKKYIEVYTS